MTYLNSGCVFIIFYFGLSINTLAQVGIAPDSLKEGFLAFVQLQAIQFKVPNGYKELITKEKFRCGDGKFTSPLSYPLSNKDTSVVIGFGIYSNPDDAKKIQKFFPKFNPDSNYIRTIRDLADTAKFPLTFFDSKYLRKFNADNGSQFSRNCNLPFLNKFFDNRIIFLDKKGKGHLAVIYLFEKSKEQVLDKEIRKTMREMIYYD